MKLVPLKKRVLDNTKWPVDCLMEDIDDYEEIIILAKVKGEERYRRFSTGIKSTFWWLGVFEAMKRNLLEESVTEMEIGQ